jgi:hypothetical protein
MSDLRLFDEDPLAGTRTLFQALNDEGDFQLITQQDHEPIMQGALDERNVADDDWKGDIHKVATIPMPVLMELERKGITRDQAEFKRWLNDPKNAVFRTRRGKV